MLFGLLVFALIVAAVFFLAATYNKLVAAAEAAARAWNDLDALLRQRHDEIPKLIELCEPHFPRERAAFDRLLEARSAIFAARQIRSAEALDAAERAMRVELASLVALAGQHPEIGASPGFTLLRKRSATLDDEITERRTSYNGAAQRYNDAIRRAPGNVVALLGGFRPLRTLAADTSVR
jgi:LemA protein